MFGKFPSREQVIDFTKPFMNLGISILFKKPDRKPGQLFRWMMELVTMNMIMCFYSCFSEVHSITELSLRDQESKF